MIEVQVAIDPIIIPKGDNSIEGFKEKDPLKTKLMMEEKDKCKVFKKAAKDIELAKSERILKLISDLEEDSNGAILDTMVDEMYNHMYYKLCDSLGCTKRAKDNKDPKTHNIKELNVARIVKGKALKGLKAWKKWKSGLPLQNGKDIKRTMNNCFNYLNRRIVEEEWEVEQCQDWVDCSEDVLNIWIKKVIDLAIRWKRSLVKATQKRVIEDRINIFTRNTNTAPKSSIGE